MHACVQIPEKRFIMKFMTVTAAPAFAGVSVEELMFFDQLSMCGGALTSLHPAKQAPSMFNTTMAVHSNIPPDQLSARIASISMGPGKADMTKKKKKKKTSRVYDK